MRPVMTRASRRAALLAVVVLLLVFAVALGSGRSLAHTGGGAPVLGIPVIGNDLLLALALVELMVLAVAGYALWGGWRRKHDDEPEAVPAPPPIPWWQKLLVVVLSLLPAAGLVAATVIAFRHARARGAARRGIPGLIIPHPAGGSRVPSAAGYAGVHWWFWGALAAVAAIAVLVMLVRQRRGLPGVGGRRRRAPAPLPVLIEESLAEIERESDPRRAVIRAYAGMEGALARHGMPRRPFEAPREFLARALGLIRVSGQAGEQLTGLFERARFSEHPVGSQMKQDAIAALAAIRDELAGQSG